MRSLNNTKYGTDDVNGSRTIAMGVGVCQNEGYGN